MVISVTMRYCYFTTKCRKGSDDKPEDTHYGFEWAGPFTACPSTAYLLYHDSQSTESDAQSVTQTGSGLKAQSQTRTESALKAQSGYEKLFRAIHTYDLETVDRMIRDYPSPRVGDPEALTRSDAHFEMCESGLHELFYDALDEHDTNTALFCVAIMKFARDHQLLEKYPYVVIHS